jgi:pyruvate/2-oxoglutarate dehydrogenase complex dihydrolipoamide acyltransferase (E2) component
MNDDGVRLTEKLWTLNPAGLAAAAVVLDRPAREMGGTARTAASGAKHARVVTDLLDAFLQPPPEPTQPVARKALPAPAAPSAAPAPAGRPEGLGPLTAWSTEAVSDDILRDVSLALSRGRLSG